MNRIHYLKNPRKFIDFQEISESQIYNACLKLRRLGYSDTEIIDMTKIILNDVPELMEDVEKV